MDDLVYPLLTSYDLLSGTSSRVWCKIVFADPMFFVIKSKLAIMFLVNIFLLNIINYYHCYHLLLLSYHCCFHYYSCYHYSFIVLLLLLLILIIVIIIIVVTMPIFNLVFIFLF